MEWSKNACIVIERITNTFYILDMYMLNRYIE